MENEKLISTAKELVTEFLTQFGLDAEMSLRIEPKDEVISYIFIELNGDNLHELIGFRGTNLEAAQVVLSMMLTKRAGERTYRLILDINNYKVNREKDLTSYAQRAAEQVRTSGQEIELRPMKPFERRVVHMALKEETGIISESIDEGESRRIKISKKVDLF
ncbi:MAG: R3H domain-containing nucleic acid-binding protein [bacterium]